MARTNAESSPHSIIQSYVECGINIDELAKNCPLDNGKHQYKGSTANRIFSEMPIELCWGVFGHLDLQTLTNLRRVNQQTRAAIDEMPPYKTVYNNAPQALRAYLSTNFAEQVTIQAIARELCSDKCSSCGEHSGRYGMMLYLLKCERLCFACMEMTNEYRPEQEYDLKYLYGMSDERISVLPRLLSLPGRYYWEGELLECRIPLIQNGHIPNFSNWQRQRGLPMSVGRDNIPYPEWDFTNLEHYFRFMAAVAIPWVDHKHANGKTGGFCCVVCFGKPGMFIGAVSIWYEHQIKDLKLTREEQLEFHPHKVFSSRKDLEAHYERLHPEEYMHSTGEIPL